MADIVDTLRNSDGDNVFPIAGGMKANSITTSMMQDNSVTNGKIADESVTNAKLGSVFLPRAIKYTNTSSNNAFYFDVPELDRAWVCVVSKGTGDGVNGGMYFIRYGASNIATIAFTGYEATASVSNVAITGGYRITVSFSGDMTYAAVGVYEVLNNYALT